MVLATMLLLRPVASTPENGSGASVATPVIRSRDSKLLRETEYYYPDVIDIFNSIRVNIDMIKQPTFVVFRDHQLLARGAVEDIVRRLHPLSISEQAELRLLDETTGRIVDFDWRGSADDIVARTKEQLASRGRGRPKLGVESREITLLPRHWHWLDEKGRSTSATLRDLIDQAMGQAEQSHVSIDALYWQMSTLAGDLPGFEEATRSLYAFNWEAAERIISTWPEDLSRYFIERLHAAANTGGTPS